MSTFRTAMYWYARLIGCLFVWGLLSRPLIRSLETVACQLQLWLITRCHTLLHRLNKWHARTHTCFTVTISPAHASSPGPHKGICEWPVPLLPAAGLLMIVSPLYELCFLYQYTSISQNSRVCLTEIDFFSFLFMFLLLPLSTRIMSTIR